MEFNIAETGVSVVEVILGKVFIIPRLVKVVLDAAVYMLFSYSLNGTHHTKGLVMTVCTYTCPIFPLTRLERLGPRHFLEDARD